MARQNQTITKQKHQNTNKSQGSIIPFPGKEKKIAAKNAKTREEKRR
jgi:hypothetical protein